MKRKLLWTTIISAIIYGLGVAAYHAGYLSLERLSKLMGMPF
jgi:predicted secreted protein